MYIYIHTYIHIGQAPRDFEPSRSVVRSKFMGRSNNPFNNLRFRIWEDRFYTPPPEREFWDCDCARIETKASIHQPLWVVVVYRIGLPSFRIPLERNQCVCESLMYVCDMLKRRLLKWCLNPYIKRKQRSWDVSPSHLNRLGSRIYENWPYAQSPY